LHKIEKFDCHTCKNLIPMVVTRALANSSKNHALLMCRIWKMGWNLFSSLDIRENPLFVLFTGNYRDSAGKSECRDFKFMGIACIPAIPVFLKSPQSDFHCNICREFDFTGILRGVPALDVGKPCNNLNFLRYACKICRDSL
jgi:hypothetical protein